MKYVKQMIITDKILTNYDILSKFDALCEPLRVRARKKEKFGVVDTLLFERMRVDVWDCEWQMRGSRVCDVE